MSFSQTARDEIAALQEYQDVGWLRVDLQPIKQVLITYASKWMWTFTKYLSDQVCIVSLSSRCPSHVPASGCGHSPNISLIRCVFTKYLSDQVCIHQISLWSGVYSPNISLIRCVFTKYLSDQVCIHQISLWLGVYSPNISLIRCVFTKYLSDQMCIFNLLLGKCYVQGVLCADVNEWIV